MSKVLTAGDARRSLRDHAADKGWELRAKYGPSIDWEQLLRILEDRELVRYPCTIRFGTEALRPGELAFPESCGDKPEDGFVMWVHPEFQRQLDLVAYVVLYQLVVVNYGPFASAGDAEAFGAAALGMGPDDYYETLCRFSERVSSC